MTPNVWTCSQTCQVIHNSSCIKLWALKITKRRLLLLVVRNEKQKNKDRKSTRHKDRNRSDHAWMITVHASVQIHFHRLRRTPGEVTRRERPGPEKSVFYRWVFFFCSQFIFRWWLTVTWVTYMAGHSVVESAWSGGIIRVPFLWLRECILRTAEGKRERTQGLWHIAAASQCRVLNAYQKFQYIQPPIVMQMQDKWSF